MRTRSLLSVAAAAAAVTAVALPGAATAATFTHRDATHDVQRFDFGSSTLSKTPHNKEADIVKTRIVYAGHSLESTVWVRSGSIGKAWTLAGQLRTSDHKSFSWLGEVGTSDPGFELDDANNNPVECDGITHHAAAAKGRVTVTIPSKCLDKPTWVKEGVAFVITRHDDHQFADDGLRKGGLAVPPVLTLSPRLALKK